MRHLCAMHSLYVEEHPLRDQEVIPGEVNQDSATTSVGPKEIPKPFGGSCYECKVITGLLSSTTGDTCGRPGTRLVQ